MPLAGAIRGTLLVSMVLLVFALGLRSTPSDAVYLFRRPNLLARSLFAMNVLLPLFVVWLVRSFALRAPVEIALVTLAASPVPPWVLRKQLRVTSSGQFTVGLFAATALLAPVSVPATMALMEALGAGLYRVQAGAIASLVGMTILVPLLCGALVRQLWPHLAAAIRPAISIIAGIALCAAVVPMLIVAGPAMGTLLGNGTVLAIVATSLAGLATGHLLGGPRADDRSALALAAASRHPAVALTVAATSFPGEKLVVAALLIALLTNAVAAAPYILWRRRARHRSVTQ